MPAPFAFTVTAGAAARSTILSGGTIVRGRDDPSQQPRAGYAQLEALDLEGTLARVPLNADVTVDLDVGLAEPVRLWSGHVTDRSDRVLSAGAQATVVGRRITAAGPLGIAPRRPVRSGGYVAQLDGQRVQDALHDAFARSWQLATRTWDELDPATPTWETWDPQLAASDVPAGSVDLAADTDADDPYQVARKAAQDAGAVLYELADGRMLYATAVARGAQVTAGPTATLPSPLAPGLATSVSLEDAATDVRVGYVGSTATASDLETARALGRVITYTRSTSLTDGTDAQTLADAILAYRRNPRPTLTLRFPLAAYSTAELQTLAQLELGDLVTVPTLPGVEHDPQGFVEQLELQLDRKAPLLVVTVSPVSAHLTVVAWTALPGSWRDTDGTWSTIT